MNGLHFQMNFMKLRVLIDLNENFSTIFRSQQKWSIFFFPNPPQRIFSRVRYFPLRQHTLTAGLFCSSSR